MPTKIMAGLMSCAAWFNIEPSPKAAPTSSAATKVVQDACNERRNPEKIKGMAVGINTSV